MSRGNAAFVASQCAEVKQGSDMEVLNAVFHVLMEVRLSLEPFASHNPREKLAQRMFVAMPK